MPRLTQTNPAPERDRARVRRRSVLAAGFGTAALGLAACTRDERSTDVEPRKLEAQAADDELPAETTPPQIASGPPLVTGSFVSAKMRGRPTRWAVVRPDGVTGRMPVVVVLHALNTNEKSIFSSKLEIQTVLQRYVDAGNAPFAIAAADAGRNYYHPRADGTDAAAMVLDEFIPMLAHNRDLDVSTDRIGLFGWSMGGYGALRLASLLGAPRVAAVAVSSPALWADPRNFPPRAFDNLADYQAHSLFGAQNAFAKIPLMISIGSSDQFFTYTRQWAAGLHPPAAFGTAAGGHTNRYWRSALPDQVEFLGRNLAR
ncbi:putative esterase [Gordonia bronchialis DSM 43247]|uniref:Esterase n=1 Tax=Gordonia bronchialis (strain ATCC 25592 / DSM 43247 / BCRC 13721 / JCM 3198 / KCTC 3076 / NBRC 16047 / NCTC 10667) TaxID=526226 RepID=D0L3E6_GORB4|nr:alpha/beta hydrolase-fold protein [Gordonia bronchialis]ACY20145.1 putative esterase [Gordonia bronchialis DSM 43247]MCC3322918.1 esterase family protein [Gordonia bronchialis]QGS26019.1 alpha/beta hydrolase [Gordonia bronchialis]UAK37582.1 esterase family protein [Gordonia bronchialis]STQ62941.1 Predicted hydrolase of the alpha/beta superfamily [Gordonia bronchialis]